MGSKATEAGWDPVSEQRRILQLATFPSGIGGCWLLETQINSNGYARLKRAGKRVLAHRWAYEMFVGPIPVGLNLDHTCHDPQTCTVPAAECPHRACVNSAHLQPVTQSENCRRGASGFAVGRRNRAKTQCPSGHPLDGTRQNGERYCRTCNRERARRKAAAG